MRHTEMSYWVYTLESLVDGSRYVGSTQNLQARLSQHNKGLYQFTKGYRPWRLIYQERFPSRAEAMRREKFLKTGRGRDVLGRLVRS